MDASGNLWYVIGFVLTVIGALFLWVVGFVGYRKIRDRPGGRLLFATFIFTGLWMLCGFVDRITPTPNDAVTLWSFRLAYLFGSLALISAFLLIHAQPPNAGASIAAKVLSGVSAAAVAVASLSPFGVRSAHITHEGGVVVEHGPLFPVVVVCSLGFCLSGVVAARIRARRSRGVNRARAKSIFWVMLLSLLTIGAFTYLLPALTGDNIYVYGAFFVLSSLPVLLLYAVAWYQLLELRLVVRKAGLLVIAAASFAAPMLTLFSVLRLLGASTPVTTLAATLLAVAMAFASPKVWERLRYLSTRIFFSGLYDRYQLESEVSAKLVETENRVEGIVGGLKLVAEALGLEQIRLAVLPGVLGDLSVDVVVRREALQGFIEAVEKGKGLPEGLDSVGSVSLLTEELYREAKDETARRLGEELRGTGVAAAIPCRSAGKVLGWLLAGEKLSGDALSSTDIAFLSQLGLRLGLYLNEHALSLALQLKLEELNAANEYKNEILTLMSHELRTPITVVLGMAELLSDEDRPVDRESQRSCAQEILRAAMRLNEMVDQAFHILQHQKGTLCPRIAEMDISILMHRLYEEYPKEDKGRLVFSLPEEPTLLPTDAEYLFIVLKSIVDNALQFSPKGSPVRVEVGERDGDVVFRVSDFGRGIPEERLGEIFDPFARAEELLHHSKGAGLGLYLAKLYADLLGATIEVESSPGKGSVFSVRLQSIR